jgi:hypothetical protein
MVRVRKQARADAKKFGFETDTRVIDFISLGVFEDIEFDNSGTLDHDPDRGTPFDAYIFRIGPKYVYFAFYQRQNGVWIIKSFHTPHVGEKAPQLSYSPFKLLDGLKK